MMLFPDNLLDVLSAAGAAKISDGRFALPHPSRKEPQVLPTISAEQAEQLIAELRSADFSHLRLGSMDFLRASGQMPTLDIRAAELARIVTADDIIRYADDCVRMTDRKSRPLRCSLRWEIGHDSDRPAALRWIGSKPAPRLSHPGRNALALHVVASILPQPPLDRQFQMSPGYDWECNHAAVTPWPFWTRRRWFAPAIPVSYATWRVIQVSGPHCDCDSLDGAGEWYVASVQANSKALSLAPPRRINTAGEYV